MIEIPRAVIIADKLAVDAEFFSFGTNDLTQLTYGFSRDDSNENERILNIRSIGNKYDNIIDSLKGE